MTQVTLEEAGSQLSRLIQAARKGEVVILMENSEPVARLVPITEAEATSESTKPHARRGSGQGLILYMAPDFDAPLDDFKEYME